MNTVKHYNHVINTSEAPVAVGTYSQGIIFQGKQTVYFSGQIGLHPVTGELAKDFDGQLKQILNNIDGLLRAAHLSRKDIIKTTIFLTDLKEFAKVNQAYLDFFEAPFPARSTVEVLGLPKGALVEIEVIAGVN